MGVGVRVVTQRFTCVCASKYILAHTETPFPVPPSAVRPEELVPGRIPTPGGGLTEDGGGDLAAVPPQLVAGLAHEGGVGRLVHLPHRQPVPTQHRRVWQPAGRPAGRRRDAEGLTMGGTSWWRTWVRTVKGAGRPMGQPDNRTLKGRDFLRADIERWLKGRDFLWATERNGRLKGRDFLRAGIDRRLKGRYFL